MAVTRIVCRSSRGRRAMPAPPRKRTSRELTIRSISENVSPRLHSVYRNLPHGALQGKDSELGNPVRHRAIVAAPPTRPILIRLDMIERQRAQVVSASRLRECKKRPAATEVQCEVVGLPWFQDWPQLTQSRTDLVLQPGDRNGARANGKFAEHRRDGHEVGPAFFFLGGG